MSTKKFDRNKPPAFQFYPADWASSIHVRAMTAAQRGCYIDLLGASWPSGIPTSISLWTLTGCRTQEEWVQIKDLVLAQFVERDGRLYNERLTYERQKQIKFHKMQADKAKKGANARWHKPGTSGAMPEDASSSSVLSSAVLRSASINSTGKTDSAEPQPAITLNDEHNSERTTSELKTQNTPAPTQTLAPAPGGDDLPTQEQILVEFGCPTMLAWIFNEALKATNPRRERLGKRQADPRPSHWKKTWIADFERLLMSDYSSEDIQKMIELAFSDRWLIYTFRPKNIVDNHDKLAGDLKIPVHELIPLKTYEEKLEEFRRRAKDKRREEWAETAIGNHYCSAACGEPVDGERQMCKACRRKYRAAQ